jgi:methyltransferase (TIGR00027 family)
MSKGASKTGSQPGFLVAAEMLLPEGRRILSDEWAEKMLPASLKAFMKLMRLRGIHRWMVKTSESMTPGVWEGILLRKRYIDDALLSSLPGMRAVVNLGAGMDTRALRLKELTGFPVWELDQPENIAEKKSQFEKALGRLPESLRLVPIDFDAQPIGGALSSSGYDPGARTFFIWEGVTQYVTEAGIEGTLRFLSGAPSGSRLAFTYVRRDFLEGRTLYGCKGIYDKFVKGKIWVWGRNPEEWPVLLAKHGWTLLEDNAAEDLAEKYIAPTGRTLSTSPLERMALAEKR